LPIFPLDATMQRAKKGEIAMAMGVCDAHGSVWKSEKQMLAGEGYLLAVRFVQRSVIQEKNIDMSMKMVKIAGGMMSRDECRLQLEFIQGTSPWLICEECIVLLKLGQADKDAAKEAAKRWSVDKSTPGHMPGQRAGSN